MQAGCLKHFEENFSVRFSGLFYYGCILGRTYLTTDIALHLHLQKVFKPKISLKRGKSSTDAYVWNWLVLH